MNILLFTFHYYIFSVIYTTFHYYIIKPYLKKINVKYNNNFADNISNSENQIERNYIMVDKYEIIITLLIDTLCDLKYKILLIAPIYLPILIIKDIIFIIMTIYQYSKNKNNIRKKNYWIKLIYYNINIF